MSLTDDATIRPQHTQVGLYLHVGLYVHVDLAYICAMLVSRILS